jgi:hypothetical protein
MKLKPALGILAVVLAIAAAFFLPVRHTNALQATTSTTLGNYLSVKSLVPGVSLEPLDKDMPVANAAEVSDAAQPARKEQGFVEAAGGTITWKGYAGTYNGNLGSVAGANSKCNTAYSGSHWCTYEEIQRLGASYPYTSPVWINGVYVGAGYSDAASNYHHYAINGQPITCGTPEYGSTENTCADWTASSGTCAYGAILSTLGAIGWDVCADTYYLACCS